MTYLDLFSTPVISRKCEIDNDALLKRVTAFCLKSQPSYFSNVGGEQHHGFRDVELFTEIGKAIPMRSDVPETSFNVHAWVNTNTPGSYNKRHHHIDKNIIFSGVYYVVTPEKCGELKFFDPRGPMISEDAALQYLYQQTTETITPHAGMLWLFPSWLEHEVTPNLSNRNRISISFNIICK